METGFIRLASGWNPAALMGIAPRNSAVLRDIVEILGLAVGLAGLVQLYRQNGGRLLLSFAGLFLLLLVGWKVFVAVDRRQEVRKTQERIVNLVRYRPATIEEITQGLAADQVPLLKDALDGLLEGSPPLVWFNPNVYLEPSTNIEYHFRAYYLNRAN